MTLLLMAAGSGSRYGKLKQFDALGPTEEFLMEFSIHDAIDAGFDHVVIITKAANKDFLKGYLGERLPANIKLDVLVQDINDIPSGIELSNDREKPWGTAHAVWTARDVISGHFVIINADDYYGKSAFDAAANFVTHQSDQNTYAIVGYGLEDTLSDHGTVSRGICKAEDGKLVSIEEHLKIRRDNGAILDEHNGRTLEPDTTVSMNFWICNDSIFDFIEGYFTTFLKDESNHEKNEIYLPFVAQEMMANKLIDIALLTTDSNWFGITYYEDKVKAVEILSVLSKNGDYPIPLWD